MKYTKPPLMIDQQIDLLQSRGLSIKKKDNARNILKRISYYRLSAYCIPFQTTKDVFIPNTSIENVLSLYQFDCKLRTILFDAIQSVEVAFRSTLTHVLSHKYGAFGYTDSSNYSSNFYFLNKWLDDVNKQIERSREVFVMHFRKKYTGSPNLPVLMVIEILSFGSISTMFSGFHNSDQAQIAQKFNLVDEIFRSWIHSLVYLRNLCAHHSRIWNRRLAIKPKKPRKHFKWNLPFEIRNDRIFSLIAGKIILSGLKSYFDVPQRRIIYIGELSRIAFDF